jgi:hypothetical protein
VCTYQLIHDDRDVLILFSNILESKTAELNTLRTDKDIAAAEIRSLQIKFQMEKNKKEALLRDVIRLYKSRAKIDT